MATLYGVNTALGKCNLFQNPAGSNGLNAGHREPYEKVWGSLGQSGVFAWLR